MKEQIKEKPNHFMGKSTGYELIDGVYYLASMYTDSFRKLADRQEGIDQLMKSVVTHVAEINKEIALERRNLWERISEDLGLDKNKSWRFHPDGTLREVEEDKT